MENNAVLKLALDEMRFLMEKQFESSDTIDQKANNLINVATLTLTIIPAIKIAGAGSMPGPVFIAVVLVVGVLYLLLFLVYSQSASASGLHHCFGPKIG